jgi:hypothetical protein
MLPTSAQGPSTKSEYVKHITNITGVPASKESRSKYTVRNLNTVNVAFLSFIINDIYLLTYSTYNKKFWKELIA